MNKLIAILLLASASAVVPSASAVAQVKPEASTGAGKSSVLATRDVLWQKMADDIAAIDSNFDGVMGVVIRDLSDGRELRIHSDEVFPSASSIKTPLILELFRQSQSGEGAKLGDLYTVRKEEIVPSSDILENMTPGVTRVTNHDLAGFAVAVSDNTATNVLIDRVGMENVNRTLDSMGLHKTRLRRKMMDLKAAQEGRENISTPSEEAAIFEAIYRGKLLNPANTQELLRMLCTEKSSYLPRLLPESVKFANKPGSLDGVRNDNGVVLLKNHPFVISVMTTYAHDGVAAEDAISAVALRAYRYFQTVENASELGRDMTP